MVHLIMRPHTEPKLDAAHHCLGQPASNPSSRPTPTPTLSPQTAGEPRAWRRKVHGARQQTLRLQQVCCTNEQRDAANQCGVRARFTHQQREISETSQRETTAQGPDSSSWHETFARISLQSLYITFITKASSSSTAKLPAPGGSSCRLSGLQRWKTYYELTCCVSRLIWLEVA